MYKYVVVTGIISLQLGESQITALNELFTIYT